MDKNTKSNIMYAGVALGSFASGATLGYCNDRGISLPTGVNPALIFLPPIVGAGIFGKAQLDYYRENNSSNRGFPKGAPYYKQEENQTWAGIGVGTLISIAFEAIGYGAGFLTSRLTN